ncbi:DUF2939 domain-containing protein [Luteimonas deserti]|uniref:DUF2939 domain-containing protein n=1 Tax=Luteimonas deserti TaxID=2752306 RepID=A0A7Z0U181_9GAMM|nr:DUF2939 domain-containing protein [Luteimonas deserti]NYZ64073.1 DUF2939 domain-containing protein [Luteimonas deserti]
MKKLAWLALAIAVLLLAYTAAGPYLTMHAIRNAVQDEDSRALSRQVDFPALRHSLRLQVSDAMVREAGADVQSSLLGAIGLNIASRAAGTGVDAMVNPVGLAALMRGRRLWSLAGGAPLLRDGTERTGPAPLADAVYRYESPSRFTATVHDEAGRPVMFVLTRSGIRWRLSDIRLPL